MASITITPRHDFYESDEQVAISIYDQRADPEKVSVDFEPRKFSYTHGEKILVLEPLKGQIDPEKSGFTVGKMKVEVRLVKRAHGRWGTLTGDLPDPLTPSVSPPSQPSTSASTRKPGKDWDGISTKILDSEKETAPEQDPNVGGDATLNDFFKKLFADADEDTKRAMMKSFQESGGTTLSTNWDEVKQGRVEVKPPTGAEWKKWN